DTLNLDLQRAPFACEPRQPALAVERERERPNAGQLALVEHEEERVAAELLDEPAAGALCGVERGEPEAVRSGGAGPASHLLHQSKQVELERERTPGRCHLLRDRAVPARERPH